MRYRFAQCKLDVRLHQLHRDSTVVGIEPKVFDVLVYLLQHRDRLVSKDELLDNLWPGQVMSETALIERLRTPEGDHRLRRGSTASQPPVSPFPLIHLGSGLYRDATV